MRKLLLCVPMISLLLLTGCAGGRGGNKAEEEALTLRTTYLEAEGFTGKAELTADYGQRVCQYQVDVEAGQEETSLTITAPDTVAGITARAVKGDTFLDYEDLVLETGPLDPDGLSPMAAVPALLEAVQSGYMTACSFPEDGVLRVDCGDPDREPDMGRTVSMWFDRSSGAMLKGEIAVDGVLAVSCLWSEFTIR